MQKIHYNISSITPNSELSQTKAELVASKIYHRNLIDYMRNGYTYCKLIYNNGIPVDFVHEEVNESYEKLTGLNNVVGKKATEIFPEINNDNPDFIFKHINVACTGISDRFEIYLKPLNKWFDITIYSPKKNYFVAMFDDITERRIAEDKLAKSEDRFRKLFENHSTTMLVVDPVTGNIIDANHAASEFYGWSVDQLKNMNMIQINPFEKYVCNKNASSDSSPVELRHRKADGSYCDVEVFCNEIDIRGYIYLYAIVHDITARKRYESLTSFQLRLLKMAETHSVEELLMAILDERNGDATLATLFNSFKEPLCYLEKSGTIIFLNSAFLTRFSNYPEMKPGSNIFEIASPHAAAQQKNKLDEVFLTGERICYDNDINGTTYRHIIYPIPDLYGNISNVLIFITDVTSHKLTDNEIVDQKVRFRNLFNNQLNGFAYCRIIYDEKRPTDFIPLVVNLNFKKLTNLQKIEGYRITEIIPNINISNPELLETLNRVAQSGVAERFDLYIKTINKWLDITAYSHQKGYFVLVLTPMKTVNTESWEWDLESGDMVRSDELRILYGIGLHTSKPTFQAWIDSIVASERSHTEKSILSSIQKGVFFKVTYHIYDNNGSLRQIMSHGFPVKNSNNIINKYIGISIDITEYRNEEITHLINTKNISTFLELSTEPLCCLSKDGSINAANNDFIELYSTDALRVIGDNFHSLFPVELEEDRKIKFSNVIETKEPTHFKDSVNKHNEDQNDVTIYNISVYPIYEINENITLIAVFITSTKNKYNTEKTRRQLDKQYQTLIAASPDSIITTNLDGVIRSISDIGVEIFGALNKRDIIGIPFSSFVYHDNIDIINDIFEITLREGLIQNKEILLKKTNNVIYSAEISAALIQDYNGAPLSYMIIIRDISQRKFIERELFHAKRLISLGEMASGIAHEIYQPINNIGLIVENILMKASNNKYINEEFIKSKSDIIFDNILRVQTIIDNIRSFCSTNDNYISSTVNINKSIRNALLLYSEQCKEKSIALDFIPEEERFFVTGNMYKFEQVILNLLKNSIDAIEEKKAVNNESFIMTISIRSSIKDNTITITIEDNGIGISENRIEYIMQPFYTTKISGKGTGLGLSISYGIIKEMNGDIKFTSQPMQGTCVAISLPNIIN